MKTQRHDCQSCKSEKSILVEIGDVTSKGITVTVKKCSWCKKQYTMSELFEIAKSKLP